MAVTLGSAVGKDQVNSRTDVVLVQHLLNQHPEVTGQTLDEDGEFGPQTLAAIVAYQSAVMGMTVPDGVLSPNGPTFARLAQTSGTPATASELLGAQTMPESTLTADDFAAAAQRLGCEQAAIQAVAMVETGAQGAFDSLGRPTILFERHIFSRLTGGAFDAGYPDISNQVPGGYGTFSSQYSRLGRAAVLSLQAALSSASWGAFQLMGENCACTGCKDVTVFVETMRQGIGAHLDAFVAFILANARLKAAIQAKDWDAFALSYNGRDYASHRYAERLQTAYTQALQ